MLRSQGRTILRGVFFAALLLTTSLVFAGSALAVSGKPLKIAEPVRYGNPAVAVDSSGTAYVAWANTTDLKEEGNKIEYCVLPAGAVACAHSGTLIAEGGKGPVVGQVQMIVDGATVVLLAEVYGVGLAYEPVQEWASTNGGATFLQVDSLFSVADGKLSADTGALNALVVPGADALGYAFVSAGGPPTFDEFPLESPPQCSRVKCPPEERFATLQLKEEAELHGLSNEPGSFASRLGTDSGVLGVYQTLGKPGCASGVDDTAFVYGSGEQSATNSYDISPGEPHSAWRKALSPGDCEAEYPAVGGGPSGLGVAEKDLTRGYEVYHQFNQITESFEPSTATIAKEGGLETSVSQDGSGGIYVTYLGNAEDVVRLAYSSTGGASWTGPETLNTNAGVANLVSSVGAGGQGWAVWEDAESVFAQQFVASDATPPAPPPPLPPPPPAPVSTLVIPEQTDNVTSSGHLSVDMECKNAPAPAPSRSRRRSRRRPARARRENQNGGRDDRHRLLLLAHARHRHGRVEAQRHGSRPAQARPLQGGRLRQRDLPLRQSVPGGDGRSDPQRPQAEEEEKEKVVAAARARGREGSRGGGLR